MYGRDLFNHELCGFEATVFVDVQAVRQLHDAAPGGSCLVERDGIDDVTAVRYFADRGGRGSVEFLNPVLRVPG